MYKVAHRLCYIVVILWCFLQEDSNGLSQEQFMLSTDPDGFICTRPLA